MGTVDSGESSFHFAVFRGPVLKNTACIRHDAANNEADSYRHRGANLTVKSEAKE
jgi:hypothetical protein